MKKLLFILFPALLASCVTKESNTENPRGVYKMTKLIGKMGEISTPYDQYQICTDSITMLATMVNEGEIHINATYDNVLNYTGESPENETDKSIRIYNSNAKGFALKWWSEYDNHIYFPKNDWCTELYEANLYSAQAKPIFEVMMNPQISENGENPYLGTWRLVGTYMADNTIENSSINTVTGEVVSSGKRYIFDVLKEDKEYLNKEIETSKKSMNPTFCSFAPSLMFCYRIQTPQYGVGFVQKTTYNENKFTLNDLIYDVTWLSKDCFIATNSDSDGNTSHDLLVREDNGQPIISKIADYYIAK